MRELTKKEINIIDRLISLNIDYPEYDDVEITSNNKNGIDITIENKKMYIYYTFENSLAIDTYDLNGSEFKFVETNIEE